MSFCFQCGAAITPGDRFCGSCGAVLRPAGEGASAQPGENLSAAGAAAASAGPPRTPDADSSDPPADSAQLAGDDGSARAGEDAGEESPTPANTTGEVAEPARADDVMQATILGGAELIDAPPPEPTTVPDAERPAPPDAAAEEPQPARGHDTGDASPAERRRQTDDVRAPGGTAPRTGFSGSRAPTQQLEMGTLLNGRYEIVRRIGGGGMGAVYYAKDKNLGDAPRAVKEMMQSNIDEAQQEKAIADFRRESMLLASLEHASIPTIYDYFYEDGSARFYLVMKYISGGDFLMRLRNSPTGRIDEQTVADWGMQVADVLHYLHSQKPPIIYRDLKPANLMIDGNSGRVMLIDFGIARWVQKEEKGVTAVGTMGYAPPELFSGKVEARSDVYSLGATMFHLLTGSDPQDNPLLIFDFTKHPRPRQINPSVSNEMERILMRAVEYNVEGRFRSAAELRDALGQHLERLRSGAVTYGVAAYPAREAVAQTVAQEMVFCGFCGGRIAADDVFCAHCGARQPIASAQAAARQARATAQLVVMGTTELDATFSIQKESVLVGRTDPQSNIFPDVDLSRFDPETKISRRHARIWRQGDTYLVEDLGSVNGTVVNETVRLGPRQPRTLEHGDKLRLGETTLHFLVG
jgi:tRNA A-37 threonylcarbamoyl transferase component Bud32/predicted nucleic acid-binding Zn ribbon protein